MSYRLDVGQTVRYAQTKDKQLLLDDVLAVFVLKAARFAGICLPRFGDVTFTVSLRNGMLHRPVLTITDAADEQTIRLDMKS